MKVTPDSLLETITHLSTWKHRHSVNKLQIALRLESSLGLETLARLLAKLVEEAKMSRAKVRKMPATCLNPKHYVTVQVALHAHSGVTEMWIYAPTIPCALPCISA